MYSALGDTSYPLYCKTGRDGGAVEKARGERIAPLQNCDVEYEQRRMIVNNVLPTIKRSKNGSARTGYGAGCCKKGR